jgi:hypothetical protein
VRNGDKGLAFRRTRPRMRSRSSGTASRLPPPPSASRPLRTRLGRSSSQVAGSHAGVGRNESRVERVPRFAFSFGWEAKCTVRLGLLLEAVFATQNTVHDPKWVWVPLLELGPFGSRPNLAMPQCTPPRNSNMSVAVEMPTDCGEPHLCVAMCGGRPNSPLVSPSTWASRT